MRGTILLAFVAVLVLPAYAAQHAAGITVEQLEQTLAVCAAAHRTDADVALQLTGMELTERLSTARLARLKAGLPGEASQEALAALADSSVFLAPPASEIPETPKPDAAALRQMLVQVVNYVNTTLHQLPNFIATRDTTRFEDRPQLDIQGRVGMTSTTYVPLHVLGRSNVLVTYRDGHEVLEKAAKAKRDESQDRGLFSQGLFGPILSTVVGDSLRGQITWSRWEEGANGAEAVFHFAVPKEKSHYSVGYCCVTAGAVYDAAERGDWHAFAEIAAYHGEIAFDPANGAILRITLESDLPPNEVVANSGMMVEYGAVDIGGQNYICPLRSVSLLLAHTTPPPLGTHAAEGYKGPTKTFLNEAVFERYHRFRAETRIVAGDEGESGGDAAAAVATTPVGGDAVSTSSQPVPAASTETLKATAIGAKPATEMSAAGTTANMTTSTPEPATAAAPVTPVTTAASAAPVTESAPAAEIEPEISRGSVGDMHGRPVAAALGQPSGYTLKVTSRLVDVSLVADDKKGRPVNGLKAEDVEVYDNGRRQEVRFFSSVGGVSPAAGNAADASAEVTFSNQNGDADSGSPGTPRSEAGATILLIDESHIGWNDLNNARTQLLQFLAGAPPDERIGLYTMSSLGFRVLTEATTDHAVVSARLRKWMPTVQSVAEAQNLETRNRQQFNTVRNVSDLGAVNGNHEDLPDGLTPIDPQLLTMGSNPARASLIILVGVARRLGAVPGHKNLVWVSSDNVFADFHDQEVGIDRTTGTLDSFALRAQEAMNDAHVAVYPFDVSQLETAAITADTQHRNVQLDPTNPMIGIVPIDRTAGRTKAEMIQDIHPIQWPVREVAEATGGRAIRRTGDLAGALSEIVEDGHATYRLSFSPDQPADGEYHVITVKLNGKQRGVTLHYRTGYLATKEPATLKERFEQAVWQPVDANELTIAAKVIPMDAGSNIRINIGAGGLGLEQQSDRWMDKLDVFFVQRDDAGLHAQVEGQTLGLRLKSSTYQEVLSAGIPYEQLVQLKGNVGSVRVLVVDENSGRMGSVTIPVSAFGLTRP